MPGEALTLSDLTDSLKLPTLLTADAAANASAASSPLMAAFHPSQDDTYLTLSVQSVSAGRLGKGRQCWGSLLLLLLCAQQAVAGLTAPALLGMHACSSTRLLWLLLPAPPLPTSPPTQHLRPPGRRCLT